VNDYLKFGQTKLGRSEYLENHTAIESDSFGITMNGNQ
jgi:hypothetical protein